MCTLGAKFLLYIFFQTVDHLEWNTEEINLVHVCVVLVPVCFCRVETEPVICQRACPVLSILSQAWSDQAPPIFAILIAHSNTSRGKSTSDRMAFLLSSTVSTKISKERTLFPNDDVVFLVIILDEASCTASCSAQLSRGRCATADLLEQQRLLSMVYRVPYLWHGRRLSVQFRTQLCHLCLSPCASSMFIFLSLLLTQDFLCRKIYPNTLKQTVVCRTPLFHTPSQIRCGKDRNRRPSLSERDVHNN